MTGRQFLWGLSNGVTMLAIAGAFWLGLGIGMVAGRVHWWVPAVTTPIQAGGFITLVYLAFNLRKKSGFHASELQRLAGADALETKHIMTRFWQTVVAQALLISLSVWPAIGLVVSLHFIPLARIFHVRIYSFTGLAGSLISLGEGLMSKDTNTVFYFGVGMAAAMWIPAFHILIKAPQITECALKEKWAR
jgi:hypothetical protein